MKRIKNIIKNNSILYFIAKAALYAGIFVVSFIESVLFLFKNRTIFKNKMVCVFWRFSFGHTILGLDYTSRLYYPHRISVIYVFNSQRSNPYLPLCFQHNMDVFEYKSTVLPLNNYWANINYRILRFLVLLLSGLTDRFKVIERSNVWKTVSLAEDRLLIGGERTNQLEKYYDATGHTRLLRDNIGRSPNLPDDLIIQCHDEITRHYPDFFSKPFVTLLLRKNRSNNFYDSIRCAGPNENYIPAVQWLVENGYHVVGTGETEHCFFKDFEGYYSLDKVRLSYHLLNLFVLMHCSFYMGQHSGAYLLANSCGIPVLLCDSMPLWRGTCDPHDIILPKHLRDRNSNRQFSLVEIFRDHRELAYGLDYQKKNINVELNSSEEILEAVKESINRVEGNLELPDEDRLLQTKFRELYPRNMLIAYEGNCPPLYMLRKMKEELL